MWRGGRNKRYSFHFYLHLICFFFITRLKEIHKKQDEMKSELKKGKRDEGGRVSIIKLSVLLLIYICIYI